MRSSLHAPKKGVTVASEKSRELKAIKVQPEVLHATGEPYINPERDKKKNQRLRKDK